MRLLKSRKAPSIRSKVTILHTPRSCRCGGEPTKPKSVPRCNDRWIIRCKVEQCYAHNIGQGLADTISGWNRLSTHFYR